MASPFQVFKSKVALAFLGACLIGGTSAALAARTALPPATPQAANVTTLATVTATPSSSSQATATSTPTTPTVANSPTTPAQPTATPNGQTNLRGTIQSVNTSTSTFTMSNGSGTHTIVVDANTTFTGNSSSLSGLQAGWGVTIRGKVQPDGTFLASSVYSYNNDN